MHRISLAIACLAVTAWGQKFEVASIKPNKENDHRVMFGMQPGGRFSATGVSLRRLMVFAYGIRDYQLSGLPAWADSDRYDINAKAEGAADDAAPQDRPPTQAEMQTRQEKTRAMLQDLLADRFGLQIHRETKEMPVYNLVVAKNGPKLVESKNDAPSGSGDAPIRVGGMAVGGSEGPSRSQMVRIGRGQISGDRVPMTMLVNQLSANLGRNVIDKTGLTGSYDVKLTWTPEEGQMMIPGGGPGGAGEGRPEAGAIDSGPSIFTAIQEQLGLKLEPAKGPVEMIVVDKADKPTEN